MGLDVKVKGIISSFLVVFGYLKVSRGISLALNMLASILLATSYLVHILLATENDIFIKQCPRWFDVNGTYRFDSEGPNLNHSTKITKWKIAERVASAVLVYYKHPYINLNELGIFFAEKLL